MTASQKTGLHEALRMSRGVDVPVGGSSFHVSCDGMVIMPVRLRPGAACACRCCAHALMAIME
jgi:hypothetical protein